MYVYNVTSTATATQRQEAGTGPTWLLPYAHMQADQALLTQPAFQCSEFTLHTLNNNSMVQSFLAEGF